MRTGNGNDLIDIFDGWPTKIDTGFGNDLVRLIGGPNGLARSAGELGTLEILLQHGDDRLEIGSLDLQSARFDGGPGIDVYRDLGGNVFGAPPEVIGFELPFEKTIRGFPVELQTTVSGRVVNESATPIEDASVYLPQLGLMTLTDAEGEFRFEDVKAESEMLEVTVGAHASGQPRSGAALVELVHAGSSLTGDIVLERYPRNTLIYGWSGSAATLEAELIEQGYRPEQVTRLDALPSDLSHYGVIWNVGTTVGQDRSRLADFVREGGGLHLTGVSPFSFISLELLVNELQTGPDVDIGVSGSPSGSTSFNPTAAGRAATHPNLLASPPAGDRFIAGVRPQNVLASFESGETVAAVWGSRDLDGGRGQLSVYMTNALLEDVDHAPIRQNLQAFLQPEAPGVMTKRREVFKR